MFGWLMLRWDLQALADAAQSGRKRSRYADIYGLRRAPAAFGFVGTFTLFFGFRHNLAGM
jgi:hypothetical protein